MKMNIKIKRHKRRLTYRQGRVRRWVSANQRLARGLGLCAFVLVLAAAWYIPHILAAPGDWWNASWSYRRKITFNNAASSENLTNFPVLVTLTPSNFTYANAKSGGADIRFVDADSATALNYEIEKWNAGGTSTIWVKVPQIDASSTTDNIYIYYGNAAAADAQNKAAVWSNGYGGVWHLGEDPTGTAPQMKDSTSNANNASANTSLDAFASTDSISGQVANGLQFRGSSEMDAPDSTSLSPSTEITVSAWVKVPALNNDEAIMYKNHGGAPWNSYLLEVNANNTMDFLVQGTGGGYGDAVYSGTLTANTWYYVVGVKKGSTVNIYVNGSTTNTTSATLSDTIFDANDSLLFGGVFATHPTILIDEGRVSGTGRSAAWVAAQYKTMAGTYQTYGAEETPASLVSLTQAAYRWFVNADGVQPGSVYADENSPYTMACNLVTPLRLRIGVTASGAVSASSKQFKLQYATSTSGPWTDVSPPVGSGSGASWYNASWTARRKITFNNSASTENLTNFPVRVSLTSANIDYSKTQSSGQDIRFTDSDGTTLLSYEIEKWVPSGTSEIWVKVPQIDAGSTTDNIYMYYGNASATDAQNKTAVWSNSYGSVWHLGEDPTGTAPQMKDSTSNGNNASAVNTAFASTDKITGQIANGLQLRNDSQMDATDSTSLSPSGDFTLSTWVKFTTTGDDVTFIYKNHSQSPWNAYHLSRNANNTMEFGVIDTNSNFAAATYSGSMQTGTWYYIVAGRSGNSVFMYVNGSAANVAVSGTLSTATFDSNSDLVLGGDFGAHPTLQMDETRESNAARSASWSGAQYKSVTNTFNTFGNEETSGGGGGGAGAIWKYFDNPTPAGGTAITALKLSASTALESYMEGNPTPLNPVAITTGGQGEWDFALDPSGAPVGTYYFRLVESSGTALAGYTQYPRIDLSSSPSQDAVMRHGQYFAGGTKQGYACNWAGS